MLLREMFQNQNTNFQGQEEEIDWFDDLKYYMDNNNNILNNYFFPAVKKHRQNKDHPDAFKLYLTPISKCLEAYCEEFRIEDKENKFPNDKLIDLAKKIAEEQKAHIDKGDYDKGEYDK
jgi:hypothetical protein